jgi:MiaB/RimO family radical SAM methylthiotransferase
MPSDVLNLPEAAVQPEAGSGPKDASAPGYHIMTWGCQMNEEDSEQMGLYLEQMGYRPVDSAADADVVLLNTCSVRAKPEEKVWSQLGRLRDLKRERPDLVIGVCGCMAQVESVEIKRRAPYVDLVVGTGNIAAIPDLLRNLRRTESRGKREEGREQEAEGREQAIPLPSAGRLAVAGRDANRSPRGTAHTKRTGACAESREEAPLASFTSSPCSSPIDGSFIGPAGRRQTIPLTLTALDLPPRKGAIVADVPLRNIARTPKIKAHVPIMYGCDKFCTFCIVPFTRGRERSRPTEEILREIEGLARGGTREITLLGQTVNSYGKNLPEGRVPFCDLLEKIDAIRGIQRIRFTSPYPRDFTDDLIDAIGQLEHVCEHVHLPLQVADDDLLQEMHRGYTVARYREIMDRLRDCVPGIAITTDIMLGYPGETDAQYENTMRFVEEVRFDSAFMFAYSPRPGTKAAVLEDQVPHPVKIARLNALIALQNRITVEINQAQVGQTFEVLVEGRSPKDRNKLTGYTRTLKTINFTVPEGGSRSAESLIGKLVPVRTVEAHLTGFTGVLA